MFSPLAPLHRGGTYIHLFCTARIHFFPSAASARTARAISCMHVYRVPPSTPVFYSLSLSPNGSTPQRTMHYIYTHPRPQTHVAPARCIKPPLQESISNTRKSAFQHFDNYQMTRPSATRARAGQIVLDICTRALANYRVFFTIPPCPRFFFIVASAASRARIQTIFHALARAWCIPECDVV